MSLINPGPQQDLSNLAIDMYFKTGSAKKIERVEAAKKTAKASRPLRWLAILHSFAVIVVLGIYQRPLGAGVPQAWLIFATVVAVAAAFWGIWAWSLVNPLPAAIIGLLLYTSL